MTHLFVSTNVLFHVPSILTLFYIILQYPQSKREILRQKKKQYLDKLHNFWGFFCILHWMDIYFKRLIIYQRNITINISDIIHYFLAGPKLKRLKLPSLPPTNKNVVIAVENCAEAFIKVFCSCSIFLDFFTLFQKLYP